jgi:hypothetical protein
MDHRANLDQVGRLGRAARIAAMVCLLIACVLLVGSLLSPTGAAENTGSAQHNSILRIF